MRIIVLLVWFSASSLLAADNTVGFNLTKSKTTNQTTIGAAVKVFDTDVFCFTLWGEAIGSNTADVFVVLDANKDVSAETSDAVEFTKAAREPFLFRNMFSGHLHLFVTSGTMGIVAVCEQGE